MNTQITIAVGAAPRGQGSAQTQTIGVQSIRGSFAWGGSPASATIVWVNNGAPAMTGQLMEMQIGGHWFAGICKSDTANLSSHGQLREMQFVDLREFLAWDYVYCAFNMPIRRFEGGVWKKKYWHIYPNYFDTYTKVITDSALPAWAIVAALFNAPTVGSRWQYDLTGNGLFPLGLMNAPIFAFDCLNGGMRLDAALNDISERGGLVYTLDARPNNNYRLVWMRKGYGLIPVLPPFDFPANSDDRRLGYSLSGNATNIRVIGERNRYLVLNVPLKPDWNTAWQQFLTSDALYLDIYNNEKDPVSGKPYANYPNDPEHWKGANDAKVRALQITVGEYVNLRNARDGMGTQFADAKKFAGKSRMTMPAALYLQTLVFRAYVPDVTGIVNIRGQSIGLDSVNILDAMPCQVTYDPVTGTMTADPGTLSDGNGLAIVQGTAFGQDMFQLVTPERVTASFFSATSRPWAAVPFQIDDSGEGQRFVIFDQPVFTSENLLKKVDGFYVINANPTISPAAAQAALTFELEPYSFWEGTYPNVSRDRAEYVSGLCAEFVGPAGNYEEILFANGMRADDQASQIAANLLLGQYIYVEGGYKLIQRNGEQLGTPLSSMIDRVEISFTPNGFGEVVDLTNERQRSHFEPERDLERKTLQNSLFPGQAQLKQQAREYARFSAGLKSLSRDQLNQFVNFLNGKFDSGTKTVRFDDIGYYEIPAGDLVDVGTPIFGPPLNMGGTIPTDTLATYPQNYNSDDDTIFCGVTVRDGEDANGPFNVKPSGETLCRVKGPVAANDSLGAAEAYLTYPTAGAYLVKGGTLGRALMAIADSSIKLIKVRLSELGDGGGDVWLP